MYSQKSRGRIYTVEDFVTIGAIFGARGTGGDFNVYCDDLGEGFLNLGDTEDTEYKCFVYRSLAKPASLECTCTKYSSSNKNLPRSANSHLVAQPYSTNPVKRCDLRKRVQCANTGLLL